MTLTVLWHSKLVFEFGISMGFHRAEAKKTWTLSLVLGNLTPEFFNYVDSQGCRRILLRHLKKEIIIFDREILCDEIWIAIASSLWLRSLVFCSLSFSNSDPPSSFLVFKLVRIIAHANRGGHRSSWIYFVSFDLQFCNLIWFDLKSFWAGVRLAWAYLIWFDRKVFAAVIWLDMLIWFELGFWQPL